MRVRPLSLLQVVSARGPEMNVAETVTLLSDMALFYPAALIDPDVARETLDAHTVRRWSTPVVEIGSMDSRFIVTRGEGRWHRENGDYVYAEAEITDFAVNAPAP